MSDTEAPNIPEEVNDHINQIRRDAAIEVTALNAQVYQDCVETVQFMQDTKSKAISELELIKQLGRQERDTLQDETADELSNVTHEMNKYVEQQQEETRLIQEESAMTKAAILLEGESARKAEEEQRIQNTTQIQNDKEKEQQLIESQVKEAISKIAKTQASNKEKIESEIMKYDADAEGEIRHAKLESERLLAAEIQKHNEAIEAAKRKRTASATGCKILKCLVLFGILFLPYVCVKFYQVIKKWLYGN